MTCKKVFVVLSCIVAVVLIALILIPFFVMPMFLGQRYEQKQYDSLEFGIGSERVTLKTELVFYGRILSNIVI